jgi:hypothetical protein
LSAQELMDAFATLGYADQGVSDLSGEATHTLMRLNSSAAVLVAGEPVVAVMMSGPMDLEPTARMLLDGFAPPEALAWFEDTQVPLLRNGLTVNEDKAFGRVRVKLEGNRYMSENGFSLAVAAP